MEDKIRRVKPPPGINGTAVSSGRGTGDEYFGMGKDSSVLVKSEPLEGIVMLNVGALRSDISGSVLDAFKNVAPTSSVHLYDPRD